nr:MAG TPA: hypothetical protein [Caudoviricetes sp.]
MHVFGQIGTLFCTRIKRWEAAPGVGLRRFCGRKRGD